MYPPSRSRNRDCRPAASYLRYGVLHALNLRALVAPQKEAGIIGITFS